MLDTKSTNNNKITFLGIFIPFILISVMALGMIAFYPAISNKADSLLEQTNHEDKTAIEQIENNNKREFLTELYKGNYCLYWNLIQKGTDKIITPSETFLTEYMNRKNQSNSEVNSEYSAGENYYDEYNEYDNDLELEKQEFIANFNAMINEWSSDFYRSDLADYGLEYYIKDNKTGKTATNSINSLDLLAGNSKETATIKDSYPFYAVFQYGSDGTLTIPDFHGLNKGYLGEFKGFDLNKNMMQDSFYDSNWYQFGSQVNSLKDVTIVYGVKNGVFYDRNGQNYSFNWRKSWAFGMAGFHYMYVLAIILVVLAALLLPFIKKLGIGNGIAARIPFEFCFAGAIIALPLYEGLLNMAMETAEGTFITFYDYTIIPGWMQPVIINAVNYVIWFIVLLVWFVSVLSTRSVFTLGLKRFIRERTLTGRICNWFVRKIKGFVSYLKAIDLTDKTNQWIMKILGVNFIILALICCFWFFGIFLLVPYTVLLYHFVKKYYTDIRDKYGVLLDAAGKMAEGNLEFSIDEDLGVFEPFKEKFTKVQYGFKKAVEEETKSQNLKTELITNVSHDLKTPLTAIITYVNLLKDGNLTEEERDSYIDTLDKKSMRLKTLIEDLFEISKASSDNVTMNIIEVDLVSLIKQVLLELGDKIDQSQVEFKNNLPEEKVILNLDSEKTYRIFENLIINITKYAMPNTRAYIDLYQSENLVTITLKNISAEELNFRPDEISERFARGDKSRNTDGSGLGLAIVKSFVELQGGRFTIQLDGDLFKAIIEWKR